jgi:plasmid stabilization system protein ParE
MDYRLLFTQRALDDLSEIVGHIVQDDDGAASRFGEVLLDRIDFARPVSTHGGATGKRSRVRKLSWSFHCRKGEKRRTG